MSEEEFITKFYSCDNEEQFLKDVYHNLKCLQQENSQLKERIKELNNQITKSLHVHLKKDERIEKAIEYIEKDTRWFDSEYASIYGTLCTCAGAKDDRLEVMVNPSNVLEILKGDKE